METTTCYNYRDETCNVTEVEHVKILERATNFVLVFLFYLITWFPTSYGPPETAPQSTPDLAADGVRSDPPLIPAEESRCCARCWSPGPTAAGIRLKRRTEQPLRCAATSPVATAFYSKLSWAGAKRWTSVYCLFRHFALFCELIAAQLRPSSAVSSDPFVFPH